MNRKDDSRPPDLPEIKPEPQVELEPQAPPIDQDILRQFVKTQAQSLYLRQQEQRIRQQEIDKSHEYALKLLETQLADRQHEREMLRNNTIINWRFLTIIIVVLVGSICYALYLNKDQIVTELIKAIIFLVSGGLGGYSLRAIKTKKDDPGE